jgi:membrane protein DedA with SNARE-associated domain
MNLEMIDTIRPYIRHYGYYAIFVGVLLENIGIPIPGETVLILGGAFAGLGFLRLPYVLLLTVLGAMIGCNIGYWIGLKGGRKILEKYGEYIFIREKQLKKVDEFFIKFGNVAIFFARFITGVRVFAAIFAGAARMSWKPFLFFSTLGAIAWAITFGSLGFLFARSIHSVGTYIFRIEITVIAFLILIILTFWHKKSA